MHTSRVARTPQEDRRALADAVVHGLAKVGLVWSLAVLGTVFAATAAHGHGSDLVEATPRTLGLALTLLVLGAGSVVLLTAALGGREDEPAPFNELSALTDLIELPGADVLALPYTGPARAPEASREPSSQRRREPALGLIA